MGTNWIHAIEFIQFHPLKTNRIHRKFNSESSRNLTIPFKFIHSRMLECHGNQLNPGKWITLTRTSDPGRPSRVCSSVGSNDGMRRVRESQVSATSNLLRRLTIYDCVSTGALEDERKISCKSSSFIRPVRQKLPLVLFSFSIHHIIPHISNQFICFSLGNLKFNSMSGI